MFLIMKKKTTTADKTQNNYSVHIAVNGYMEITDFLCPVPTPSAKYRTLLLHHIFFNVLSNKV